MGGLGGTIQYGDLVRALGGARATFTAHVGAGSSTTTIPLGDLNLGSTSQAGNFVLLDAGALGAGTEPTVALITSNTATVLTVPVLTAAPLLGYTVRIFAIATIQADVTVALDAEAATGAAVPAKAVQMGGTDGTDLRGLAVDSSGRLTPQPQGLPWDAAGIAVAAGTNVFGVSYQPPTAGTLTITIGNLSTGTSSVADIVKTANTAPSGGSAGTRIFALNSGNAIVNGQIGTFQLSVTPNDSYNLQFVTATTVDITATFKPN